MVIGLISDTHDYLDPLALRALKGVDFILHAGDVGRPRLVSELLALAPTEVVLGNTDDLSFGYRERERVALDGRSFLLQHIVDPQRWDAGLERAITLQKPDFVIFGHTHRPFDHVVNGIRFINPGSAGKKRFALPRTVGLLEGNRYACLDLEAAPKDSPERLEARLVSLTSSDVVSHHPEPEHFEGALMDPGISIVEAQALLPSLLRLALRAPMDWAPVVTRALTESPERFGSLTAPLIHAVTDYLQWALWGADTPPSERLAIQCALQERWNPMAQALEP